LKYEKAKAEREMFDLIKGILEKMEGEK